MIPYSILAGKMNMEDGKEIEFGILELGPDFFSFRTGKRVICKNEEIKGISLFFSTFPGNKYKTVTLMDYSICREAEEEFYDIYRLSTEDESFRAESCRLSKLYLDYVKNRLSLSDGDLSGYYTDYPAEGDDFFYESMEASVAGFFSEVESTYNAQAWESLDCHMLKLYYALENEAALATFIEQQERYRSKTIDELCKLKHPVSTLPMGGVLIGNPYCPNLFPDIGKLSAASKVCRKNGWKVHLVLAPIPESRLDEAVNYIEKVIEAVRYLNGFSVNDAGIYYYITERHPDINVESGVLMNKGYRDPRAKYIRLDEADNLMKTGKTVYGPLFQTNTATFCTLHALVNRQDRGNNKRVGECMHLCDSCFLMYPKHLNTIGRYNSIFGFNASLFSSPDILRDCLENGVERLVINL